MNLTPEFESTVQHTVQGVLCTVPLIPLFLYVAVYSYTVLVPLLAPMVKWRPKLRVQRVAEAVNTMRQPVRRPA